MPSAASTAVLVHRELNLEFEIPFRELGFHGVPHRSTAFVMPTVNCLVELVESPATVIAMPAVAIVNLERVGFNLRNFDMVVVYKVCAITHLSACVCMCVHVRVLHMVTHLGLVRSHVLMHLPVLCASLPSNHNAMTQMTQCAMTKLRWVYAVLTCQAQLLTIVSMHANVVLSLMQDLTKDVFRIDAIPSQSLDTVREWLSSMDIKFYENKVNLNWKQVLKSIVDVSTLSICHCCMHATQSPAACSLFLPYLADVVPEVGLMVMVCPSCAAVASNVRSQNLASSNTVVPTAKQAAAGRVRP